MTTSQTTIFATVFTVFLASGSALTGCSSARTQPDSRPEAKGDSARHPASAEDALIKKFAASLVKESALGGEGVVEDALTQVMNENADKLSISKIRNLEDVASLSEAEQKKLINQMIHLPGFSEKLAVNMDAVQAARREAVESMQNVKGVTTEAVADIHGTGDATSSSEVRFANILQRAPELKADVELMIKQNKLIQDKTGASVLGKGCNDLQAEESVENVATIITGVERDVATGNAKDTPGVAKSLEKNVGSTLGTTEEESHRRVCVLAKGDGCAVFSPTMCR